MARKDPLTALAAEYGMFPPGSTVLCAVSGGADSVYLLHRLESLRLFVPFTLVAVHYNHRLRGEESDRDEQFVRDFVSGLVKPNYAYYKDGEHVPVPPVELIVGSGDVAAEAKRRGKGIEETAREMRYAFLFETAERVGADRIATAHNADDNAETVLLHLIRGCGLRGLTGIRPRQGKLVRPLLTTTRKEIEDYLRLYSIPHVEDSSNADDTFSRNKVRHQIVPLLNEINPWFTERMADTARLLRTDEDFLAAQAEGACESARLTGETLTIPAAAIAGLPDAVAPRAVRRLMGTLQEGSDDCTALHLEAVAALARRDDPSAEVHLPRGLTARRVYGDLVLTTETPPGPLVPTPLNFDGVTAPKNSLWRCVCRPALCPDIPEPGTWHLAKDALSPGALLRPRQVGDALALPHRGGTKTVKKWLIDAKVPRLDRERIPVLADNDGVAALAGFGPEQSRLAAPGQPCWAIRFEKIDREKEK